MPAAPVPCSDEQRDSDGLFAPKYFQGTSCEPDEDGTVVVPKLCPPGKTCAQGEEEPCREGYACLPGTRSVARGVKCNRLDECPKGTARPGRSMTGGFAALLWVGVALTFGVCMLNPCGSRHWYVPMIVSGGVLAVIWCYGLLIGKQIQSLPFSAASQRLAADVPDALETDPEMAHAMFLSVFMGVLFWGSVVSVHLSCLPDAVHVAIDCAVAMGAFALVGVGFQDWSTLVFVAMFPLLAMINSVLLSGAVPLDRAWKVALLIVVMPVFVVVPYALGWCSPFEAGFVGAAAAFLIFGAALASVFFSVASTCKGSEMLKTGR
eukprot:CAMPEP_0198597950 /NCGR_PEP_ID=MMETSP1462-20131121/145063_1 /TAXON_ID=1333877 /ORGANISM="Brandtodinium nutriculum, Strain RCC3387" /LENGTH=320 /DNA_ID=CAMNT_0044329611 /DNA_START=130 /DNA_END=1089 /DNA_ORIENTATION=-